MDKEGKDEEGHLYDDVLHGQKTVSVGVPFIVVVSRMQKSGHAVTVGSGLATTAALKKNEMKRVKMKEYMLGLKSLTLMVGVSCVSQLPPDI